MNPTMKMLLLADREQPTGRYNKGYENIPAMAYNPNMGGYKYEPEREFETPMGKHYEPSMTYGSEHPKHKMQIGFAGVEEKDIMPFSQMTAEKWTRNMESEDGSKGAHWSMEQVKMLMTQKGITTDPWEFFAAINAMYSDYSKVFKKHGIGDKIDLYVDLAKAFIDDKDAQPDKLARYYQYIVKH